MTNVCAEICEHNSQPYLVFSNFSVFPRSLHTVSLYIDMKMIVPLNYSGSHCNSVIFFESLQESQCCDSWEYFPLEFHRLSIDSVQIFEIAIFQIPFNLVLTGFDWLVTHVRQTEHRVGENVGFGIRNHNSFVTW